MFGVVDSDFGDIFRLGLCCSFVLDILVIFMCSLTISLKVSL